MIRRNGPKSGWAVNPTTAMYRLLTMRKSLRLNDSVSNGNWRTTALKTK